MRRLTTAFVAVSLLLVAACGPTIPTRERPAVVTVVYDPATSNLPTPNDLALGADGVVTIAPNPALSATENALKATFNGRKGFSGASSVRAQFSAPVSAASVTAQTVLAFDLGEGAKGPVAAATVSRTYADCDTSVTLAAPAGFAPGHTYLFAVRGGDDGVKGRDGEEVVAAPAFYFLRAGEDLTKHPDALPGATRAEKQETAARLEAVRQRLEPFFAVLEAQGVQRREVAALWTFTVHEDAEALQDPGSKRIPMPNDLLRDATTGLVSLPADPADAPAQAELKRAFNQLDGFSTTAALSITFTAPIDRATVTARTVRLATAAGAEVTDLERTVSADAKKLVLQPKKPLLPATSYVVLLAGVKDTQGALVAPTPLSSVLSLGLPLTDADGHSTVSSFCDDTAGRLESLRAHVSAAVDALAVPRTEVSAAWTFTTQDLVKRAQELWRAPYEANLPLAIGVDERNTPAVLIPYNTISGTLTTYDRLDPATRAFRENGTGTPRPIHYTLTVPRSAAPGSTVKVVVFGHGLYTERRLVLLLADKLARANYAMLAIDLPYHGERTVCRTNAECSLGATCAADGVCLKNGQVVDFARTPAIPGIPGEGFPTATGQAFVDVEHLPATRDHFRQAVTDLSAVTRVVKLGDWREATQGVALDGTDIRYAGISLGGILGGLVSGVDPSYRAMLLNVGGAGLVDLMRESATFKPILTQGLADKGIVEGTPEYESFVNAAKWLLDEVDPINLAPYALARPLEYVDPASGAKAVAGPKALRLQMAIGDTVVPNSSTRRLLEATGVDPQRDFREFIGTHGFLADPVEINCYVGQDDLVTFMENH
ncbi:MAG: Ig-like domain-containing protein [Myxococcota bacterium]